MKENNNTRKNLKKEVIAISFGLISAYCWQLFGVFLAWAGGDTVTKEYFIPIPSLMIIITLILGWLACGYLKVSWEKQWIYITCTLLGFCIPFALISMAVIFARAKFDSFPNLFLRKEFYIVTAMVSFLPAIATCVFIKKAKAK